MKKKVEIGGFSATAEYRIVDGEVEVYHISEVKGGNTVIMESMDLIMEAERYISKEIKNGNAD